jgi:hypothetical protein
MRPIKILHPGEWKNSTHPPNKQGIQKEKIVMNVDNNFCRRNEKWIVLLLPLEKFFGCVGEARQGAPDY